VLELLSAAERVTTPRRTDAICIVLGWSDDGLAELSKMLAELRRKAIWDRRLVRLGAQLCAADGTLVDRDFARAWLPATLAPGARADVPIEIPTPGQPGRYSLKFDLVSEGIDWFERCGSDTTVKTLLVR